jgi:hypothetical protein
MAPAGRSKAAGATAESCLLRSGAGVAERRLGAGWLGGRCGVEFAGGFAGCFEPESLVLGFSATRIGSSRLGPAAVGAVNAGVETVIDGRAGAACALSAAEAFTPAG